MTTEQYQQPPKIYSKRFGLRRARYGEDCSKLTLHISTTYNMISLHMMREQFEEILDDIAEYATPEGHERDTWLRYPRMSITITSVFGCIVCNLIKTGGYDRTILFSKLRAKGWTVDYWY